MDRSELKKIVFDKTGGRCAYCGVELDLEMTLEMDHVTPISRGGRSKLDNFVPSCRRCNARKYTRTPKEFKNFMKDQIIRKYNNYVYEYVNTFSKYLDDNARIILRMRERDFLDAIENAPLEFVYEPLINKNK